MDAPENSEMRRRRWRALGMRRNWECVALTKASHITHRSPKAPLVATVADELRKQGEKPGECLAEKAR